MTDKLSGSADIMSAILQMLETLLIQEEFSSVTSLLSLLEKTAREIITAQSGMAAPVTLFNRLFWTTNPKSSLNDNKAELLKAIKRQRREAKNASKIIHKSAAALIPHDAILTTHSASSTVFHTIALAKERGRIARVFVLESRPLFEGRLMASRLADAGIPVTILVDCAMYANMPETELVLVGADAVSTMGVVSKIGTGALSVCAQYFDVPLYVVADTPKIWPAELGKQPIHERPPDDVWVEPSGTLDIQNRTFDTSPWSSIAGVITEQGVFSRTMVEEFGNRITIHPAIHSIVAEVRSTVH